MISTAVITGFDALAEEIAGVEKKHLEKELCAEGLSLELRDLRARLAVFSGEYYSRVGMYYARLDVVEIELNMYRHRLSCVGKMRIDSVKDMDPIEKDVEEKFNARYEEAKKRLDETKKIGAQHRRILSRLERFELFSEEKIQKLSALYRRLALLFHPDKAKTEQERIEFTGIMADINEAYAGGDFDLLASFLEKAKHNEKIKTETAQEKHLRLKVECATLDTIIKKLQKEQKDIQASDLWKLKLRVEEAGRHGDDILAEMTRRAKNELRQRQEQLDALIKEYRSVVDDAFERIVKG